MKINNLTVGQIWRIFRSLKEQYEAGRPMTPAEERTMWRSHNELKSRGYKWGLYVNKPVTQKTT